LGEVAAEYLKQLKSKMKEKYSYYLKVQDEENKGKIIRVLNKWYSILEQRIQNNEFKSIDEITKDFITLEERLNDTFQNYAGKTELFNEFKTRVFAFAGNYFSKKAESEKKFIEEQNEQKIKKLKDDLENAKNKFNKQNEKKQIILSQNKTQINDLQEELNQTKETLALTQKEKGIESMNFNNQMNRLKDDYERRLRDAETKTTDNEEKSKDAERKMITIKADFDKQKALLNQKIDHLNRQLEDFTKREKEMKQETYSQLKEQQIAYKDKVDKYEKTIKSLTVENDQLKEQVVDLEANVEGLGLDFQSERNRNEELIEKTNKEIESLEEDLNNLKKKSHEEKEKIESEYTTKIEELTSKVEIDIPEAMVKASVNDELKDFERTVNQQYGMKLEEFKKIAQVNEEEFMKNINERATKKLKETLVLEQIVKQEKLQATQDEINKSLEEIAEANNMKVEDVKKYVNPADVAFNVSINKVIDLLIFCIFR